MTLNYLIYVISNQQGQILDAGVANETSEIIHVSIPDYGVYLECELYHAETICQQHGLTLTITEQTKEIKKPQS